MWGVSEATVAYYAPHLGGMFNFVDRTGFIDDTVSKGRVWYVSQCVSVCRKANCVGVRTVCALFCCQMCHKMCQAVMCQRCACAQVLVYLTSLEVRLSIDNHRHLVLLARGQQPIGRAPIGR